MLWAFFLHRNLSLFLRSFKLVNQRKQTPFLCPTNHYSEGVGLETKGAEVKGGRFWGGECVVW
jgi:hypothetical protein